MCPVRLTPAVLVLLLAAVASGCTDEPPSPWEGLPAEIDYVALGDSFSSGPLIHPQRQDPAGCGRSGNNYPAFLAGWLDVATYADRTCSGARTVDLADGQPVIFGGGGVPPQLDAVDEETDLITVGIGVNDSDVYGTVTECLAQSLQRPCSPDLAETQLAALEEMRDSLADALDEVHDRAPDAIVVLVGYPRILPPSGTCPQARVSEAAADQVREVEVAWGEALRSAAEDTDTTYVDLVDASQGHDVCAGEQAWVNGPDSVSGYAAAFHPVLLGMRGAAAETYRALTGEAPPADETASPPEGAVVSNETSPTP